jgi:hypothetical protein
MITGVRGEENVQKRFVEHCAAMLAFILHPKLS